MPVKLRALWDTGATVTAIRPETLEILKSSLVNTGFPKRITGIGGVIIEAYYTLTNIYLTELTGHFNPANIGQSVYVADKEMVGHYENDFRNAVSEGREFNYYIYMPPLKTELHVYLTPIEISDTPWCAAVAAPVNVVMNIFV